MSTINGVKDMVMISTNDRPRARFKDPLSVSSRVQDKLYTWWLRMSYPFASTGRSVSIHHPCQLDRQVAHQIKLGSYVIIWKDAWLNIVGERDKEVKLIIEDNCTIGARNILSAKNLIHIEQDVILAASVLIQDHNHAYEDIRLPIREQGATPGGTIRIERGCWIGQGVAIVCNEGELVIGHNSVVGANSLVTRSFPPYSVIIGNPARLARQFDSAKVAWVGGEGGRAVPSELGR
jgi:acetyltransferase-like isoleucine patch superfamily enzyme